MITENACGRLFRHAWKDAARGRAKAGVLRVRVHAGVHAGGITPHKCP